MRINWQQIGQKRDKLARMDNARENNKRLPYEYTVGEKILIVSIHYERNRKVGAPTKGPYEIVKVNRNGTVVIERNQYCTVP